MRSNANEHQNAAVGSTPAPSLPHVSLPKGGGAIRGIGEKFGANPVTGTASFSVPIAVSPGRSGFGPRLDLSYDSGAGNGPFGIGWTLGLPAITRKTDKGLPAYRDAEESDTFILSGAEDLVPALDVTSAQKPRPAGILAWGANGIGQLGDGTRERRLSPVPVPGLDGAVTVVTGWHHGLSLHSDGTVRAWGKNDEGQLGDGNSHLGGRLTPAPVLGLGRVTAVAAGAHHSLALRADGTVWAWGFNADGQLGDGTTETRLLPVRVSGLDRITAVATNAVTSLALRADGTVWAWGASATGQVGNGTTERRLLPVQVSDLDGVTAVVAGGYHALAIRTDGTVWAWGYGLQGQIGDGRRQTRLVPIRVPALDQVTAVAAGFRFSLALRTDGTLWAWGYNNHGQIGDGTTETRFVPIRVPGLDRVAGIAAGTEHALAVRTDGTVHAWGRNDWGQLGDGTDERRLAPVPISSQRPFADVAAGWNHSFGLTRPARVDAQEDRGDHLVRQYRPRVEGTYARIECWTEKATGHVHWRSISRGNVTTIYGKDASSRITDPTDPARIFSWLIAESYDDKGNAIVYRYVAENDAGTDRAWANECNRSHTANRYLKRIQYGNRVSRLVKPDLDANDWLFEVIFDYDEGHLLPVPPNNPGAGDNDHRRVWGPQLWAVRGQCGPTPSPRIAPASRSAPVDGVGASSCSIGFPSWAIPPAWCARLNLTMPTSTTTKRWPVERASRSKPNSPTLAARASPPA